MKRILILLCLPIIGFGQDDCGEKPEKPAQKARSTYVWKTSKEYKKWNKEYKIWEDCIGGVTNTNTYTLSSFDTDKGTFDYVNGVRYRVVFNEDLDIKSQTIKINSYVASIFVSFPMTSAQMKVEKKEGRTRITVTDFDIGEVGGGGGVIIGNVVMTDSSTEPYKMNNIVWNEKKQTFRKSFVKKYSKQLEKSILTAVERLIKDNSSDDDW